MFFLETFFWWISNCITYSARIAVNRTNINKLIFSNSLEIDSGRDNQANAFSLLLLLKPWPCFKSKKLVFILEVRLTCARVLDFIGQKKSVTIALLSRVEYIFHIIWIRNKRNNEKKVTNYHRHSELNEDWILDGVIVMWQWKNTPIIEFDSKKIVSFG